MSKKDFIRGVEAAAKANEAFMRKQAAATEEIGKRIVQKIDGQGKIIDIILDTLNEQEKKELYALQSQYDIAELGENEKEVLASYLLTLISKYEQNTDAQKDYYFAVKKHLGVTDVSDSLNLSAVENVDSRTELKAMFQTVCEFLFLKTGDTSFLDEFEDELDSFGLTNKVVREIIVSIVTIYDTLGLRGIVEHYIPAEPEVEEEKKDTRIILDWKEDKEFCLQNGIEINSRDNIKLVLQRDCIIRNFKKIEVDDAQLENCSFENCDSITINDGFITKCTFSNIGCFWLNDVKILQSTFQNLEYCDEDEALFYLSDTKISESVFENISLQDNAYLFDADGSCNIEKSRFENIESDRADRKLYTYVMVDGKGIFKQTFPCTLIEKDTCEGLDGFKISNSLFDI